MNSSRELSVMVMNMLRESLLRKKKTNPRKRVMRVLEVMVELIFLVDMVELPVEP
jgi:hypothetical protein